MRNNHQQRNIVATGGKENDLKIWDLQKLDTAIFAAKNVNNIALNFLFFVNKDEIVIHFHFMLLLL